MIKAGHITFCIFNCGGSAKFKRTNSHQLLVYLERKTARNPQCKNTSNRWRSFNYINMKKLIFSIFILFFISHLKSQPVDFNFSDNSRWKYFEKYWSGQTGLYNEIDYEYFINGDTIITSISYKKLYENLKHRIIDFNVPPNDTTYIYVQNNYKGAIRETDNKIVFIHRDSFVEYELYNYNLDIGDTIFAEVHKGEMVQNIDTL